MSDLSDSGLRALIFDFDGVLVDSEPTHFKALLKAVRPLGMNFDYDVYLKKYLGYDDAESIKRLFSDFGLEAPSRSQVETLVNKKAEYLESFLVDIKAPAGIVKFIDRIPMALPLAICSGALRSDIEKILPLIYSEKILDRFQFIVSADDVSRSKPDPEPYQLALKKLRCEARHALAFEDSPKGIQSARAAGLSTIALANTLPRESLLAYSDHVVEGWDELDFAMTESIVQALR